MIIQYYSSLEYEMKYENMFLPGREAAAIRVSLFDDRSKKVTFAGRVTSFAFTSVMTLEEAIRVLSCLYWGRLAGMRVSLFFPKLRMATGVVAGIFFTIVSMSASPSPWLEQSIVSVVLSPLVGRQVQGRMDATGH